MPGEKTNERPGTRALLRYCSMSAYKVRPVLDLIRGKTVAEARDILRFSDRDAAIVVGKLLDSAVANAAHNDELDAEDLYVSACFADEGMTHKRWRPRARGRATRIRKRTSHVTVIVSRLPDDKLQRLRAKRAAETQQRRARRVAGGRAGRRQRRDEQQPGTAAPVAGEVEGVSEAGEAGTAEAEVAIESEVTEAGISSTTELPDAAEVAAIEEEEGIVDQQAEAVAQAEEIAAPESEEEEGE
jgi:large subunit ribosomal protein L22